MAHARKDRESRRVLGEKAPEDRASPTAERKDVRRSHDVLGDETSVDAFRSSRRGAAIRLREAGYPSAFSSIRRCQSCWRGGRGRTLSCLVRFSAAAGGFPSVMGSFTQIRPFFVSPRDNPKVSDFVEETRRASIAAHDIRTPISSSILQWLSAGSVLLQESCRRTLGPADEEVKSARGALDQGQCVGQLRISTSPMAHERS
jgi:hypothetical protein